ncbi:lysylphosphatidylglycerol synthase transmembrane domain-containing protein [Pectinatus haikarae]|uniref:Phosphatidylglycerol lysyltransferase n=1 Tax=Pectinatus haikarae TaxID=349096 RepID=A0ABT9Y4W2_9FIRM|nr:lysylphosphatidylglycerol synthase transmembrane domain-containing protein [Pectinatus haikarae]MDQ0202591.1 uncharacterized protein (TIRG00374 family) [Pectinatus haikarae]
MDSFNISDLQKKVILGLLLSLIVFTIIIFLGNVKELIRVFETSNKKYFLLATFFTILIYSGRFLKWDIFLMELNIHIPLKKNIPIFLSGLSMGITPGKVGEVLKSYILKEKYKIDFCFTAPTIIGERLTGVLGCFCLFLLSIIILGKDDVYSYYILSMVVLVAGTAITFFKCQQFANYIFESIGKIKFINKRIQYVENFYNSAVKILGLKMILIGICISIFYWLMECFVFYNVLRAFNVNFDFSLCVFILTISSIGGGLSLMPGSIGILEGGLIGLLVYQGLDYTLASEITLIYRFFAMWSVIMIGGVFLVINIDSFKLRGHIE